MAGEYWMPYVVGPLLSPSSLTLRRTLTARAEPRRGWSRGY